MINGFRRKAFSAQAHRVDANVGKRLARCFYKRRYVFAYQGATRNERVRTNIHKLLHRYQPGEYYAITDGDMSGKGGAVRKNTIVANDTVVRHVAIGHDEAVGTNFGHATICGTSIDGNTFSDCGVITNNSKGFFSFVLEVLRDGRDYCSRKYSAIFTYASSLHNRNVGGDIGTIANFYILVNGSKRVNFYIFPDFSV